MSRIRAEHPSLAGYLRSVLREEDLRRVGIVSFNQWGFVLGAIGEVAATLHDMGAEPVIALWADDTPMRDVGWTTSRRVARLLRSPSRDMRLREGLMCRGLPAAAFAAPPLRRWKPAGRLPAADERYRSAIRRLTYRGAAVGSAILQSTPDTETPVTDDFLWPPAWLEAGIRSYAWAYDQTEALIAERGLTALIAYNGRFLHDSAAAAAAEAAGIPVLSYDMGGNDTDFDLTIDATHDWSALQRRMLAMYASWPVTEREAVGASWFLERSQHADERNARFTDAQRIGQGIERPPGRLVAYFSSSGDEISELDLDWSEYFHGQPGALLAVARVCREAGATLLVRTHPHKRRKPRRDVEEWHEAVAAAAPDIHLDEHSPVDSYTLMRQADVVVTYGSTTGVEAAYAGRPVVVTGPSAYDELGCATRVRDEGELRSAILDPRTGDREGALAYGLMMRRRGFRYEIVSTSEPGDIRAIGGVDMREPSRLVRSLSDLMVRIERRRLRRGSTVTTVTTVTRAARR